MSVVVKRLRSTSMEIYVKGAPEVMFDICDRDSCGYSQFVVCGMGKADITEANSSG